MKKSYVIYFLIYLIIIIFVFRSLFFNLSTNLIDWRDYPTIDWMIFHSVSKITTLDFSNYFDTNAFYPNKYSLLFSDLLIPQAILETPFYMISNNSILSFNIVFFLTFILNYFATFLFWRQIFKQNILAFMGSLFVIFSPFVHLEISHFPMLSFWPFFFSFYFILKTREKKNNIQDLLLSGIFLAIQFLASAYLSFFLVFIIFIFYFVEFLKSRDQFFIIFRNLGIIFLMFILINGYFIKGYIDTKKLYNINHDLKENVVYSAHLSDYIFTSHVNSIIHQSNLVKKWNNFNKNTWGGQASFPGLLLFGLFIYSFFEIRKNKDKLILKFDIHKEQLFFTSLLFFGFLFSLGPRLNFNGTYVYIPTPYDLLLRIFPLVSQVRAPCRWYFIFIIAITYFALKAVQKIQPKIRTQFLVIGFLLLFFFEYIPMNITTHSEEYINPHYVTLKNLCSQKKLVLLELPVTHLSVYPDIISGLNYISKVQFVSIYHDCYLVNGYSSYDMPHLNILSTALYQAILDGNSYEFIKELKKSQADIIKFNSEFFPREVNKVFPSFLRKFKDEKEIKQIDNEMYQIYY